MNTSKILFTLRALLAAFLLINGSSAQDLDLQQYGEVKENVRHVNATEAAEILEKHPSVSVLDVRTGFEYNRGHLDRSTNVNYYSRSFKKSLEKLDKNTTWLVHCRSGVRSGKSLPIMKALGFTSIIHLDGGIVAWNKAGQSVIKK